MTIDQVVGYCDECGGDLTTVRANEFRTTYTDGFVNVAKSFNNFYCLHFSVSGKVHWKKNFGVSI